VSKKHLSYVTLHGHDLQAVASGYERVLKVEIRCCSCIFIDVTVNVLLKWKASISHWQLPSCLVLLGSKDVHRWCIHCLFMHQWFQCYS